MKQPGIFLSRRMASRHGDSVREACGGHAEPRLIEHDPDAEPDAETLAGINAAYLTPDIIASPDRNELRSFFNALFAAPNLKWLHVCSAGTDGHGIRKIGESGVRVTNSSGANAKAVAHAAIAGMLAMARDVPSWVTQQSEHRWDRRLGGTLPPDLDGATAVVVGLGPIGRDIARLCKAFGMTVRGVRRSAEPVPECDAVYAQSDLAQAVAGADWLFVACPLTDETRNLIDARIFAAMPRHGRMINVGRGPVVDEEALLAALRDGTIAGAYSDVFVKEPLPADSPLWDAPNLLISPHVAGASAEFFERANQYFYRNLAHWVRDEEMENVARFG